MMLRSEFPAQKLWLPMILTALVGAGAAALVWLGNPGNMGICGACFIRDIGGALGFFTGPQIFRPEVPGLILGAFLLAIGRRSFVARSGSHAFTRFFFSIWMAIGALVFLGCPFRMLQRIGGGDLTAWIALLGFFGGVGIGQWFERRGYSIGETAPAPATVGLLAPLTALAGVVLFALSDVFRGPGPGSEAAPPHAFWLASLGVTLAAGAILSATGFCTISAGRQIFGRGKRMLVAMVVLVAAYAVVIAAAKGGWTLSAEKQPLAHSDALWSVLAMLLVGVCGVLVGGCPVRLIVMTGEGNGDAAVGLAGMLVGSAIAHNWGAVSSAAGPTERGMILVVVGLGVALAYGIATTIRRRA